MAGAASIRAHGRTAAIGHGSIRHHRLRITFRHPRRGRYRVTLRLAKGSRVIGRTTIVVT